MRYIHVALLGAALSCTFASYASTPDLSSCNSWQPAASCNYTASSRPGAYSITYVIIHKAQGSAASAASWFQNCAAGSSAHFSFDNNNGYCYQMVYEKDIAWHAANWSTNCHSIGIEHGGYVANNDNSRTMYNASSIETRSTIIYYSVLWDRAHILGHNQVPGATHTDPGSTWDWTYYMSACDTKVVGAIRDHYLALGGAWHALGYATTGELGCPDGVGRYNHFQGGSIYWTPSGGAWSVQGAIHTHWQNLNWENGVCGYPTTDENTCPDGVGKYNHFTGKGAPASIYWTPSTGAWEVHGAIRSTWANMGWERSSLGYPTSDEYTVPGTSDRRNNFQGGTLTWHAANGTVTLP